MTDNVKNQAIESAWQRIDGAKYGAEFREKMRWYAADPTPERLEQVAFFVNGYCMAMVKADKISPCMARNDVGVINVTQYLAARGPVKALTTIEAETFGIAYPLLQGWASRHGNTAITLEMQGFLRERIIAAKSSTAGKAAAAYRAAFGSDPFTGIPMLGVS